MTDHKTEYLFSPLPQGKKGEERMRKTSLNPHPSDLDGGRLVSRKVSEDDCTTLGTGSTAAVVRNH